MEGELEVCLAEFDPKGPVNFQSDSAVLRLSPQQWQIVRDRRTGRYSAVDIPFESLT